MGKRLEGDVEGPPGTFQARLESSLSVLRPAIPRLPPTFLSASQQVIICIYNIVSDGEIYSSASVLRNEERKN